MTDGTVLAAAAPAGRRLALPSRAGMRLVRLHAVSRRVPATVAAIAACAIGLRIALIGHWDAYGALQLPLIFEAAAVMAITVTTASPFGEPERAGGRWLPFLRLALACPAAGRPGRGDLRRPGVRLRGSAHHRARSPGSRRGVTAT